MKYEITLEQLKYLVNYARHGLAASHTSPEFLEQMLGEIQSQRISTDKSDGEK